MNSVCPWYSRASATSNTDLGLSQRGMPSAVRGRSTGPGRRCLAMAALLLAAASPGQSNSDLISVSEPRVSVSSVAIEIRNDSGRLLHLLGERAWNRRNYLKIGLWPTGPFAPPPRSSDARPDLDGELGSVRWIDPPEEIVDGIRPGASEVVALPLPAEADWKRYYVVVLVRSSERWRTEIVPLPLLNGAQLLPGILFLVLFGVEARSKRTRPSRPLR